ncbi:MAG: hypothetical protein SP1CHLAM54_17750 [Chlamydiia bacterium]|nr:hypothetical protein [Chlamydiia bacterium]MCH9616663.1 hypothetical protein [Chlamydiia bacterium]MCH9629395.1 hypothetical protein [Chlamydiia bacterium]
MGTSNIQLDQPQKKAMTTSQIGLSSGIGMIRKGMDWNVHKVSFAYIIIIIMVTLGLDNIQNQISDRSSYQRSLSGGQTLAAEIQNFINKDLQAVVGNGTSAHPGARGLDWGKAGNVSNLQGMMKNISSIYYSNNTQSSSDTWGSMQVILPNGTVIPLMEKTTGGYTVDPALLRFAREMRSWLTGAPVGAVDWTKSGAIPALGSGQSQTARLPGDTYSSQSAAMDALFGMQPPLYMVLAFKKLQNLVDTDYKITKAEIDAAPAAGKQSKLQSLFGSFDAYAPLKGFKSLYNDMNTKATFDYETGVPVSVNFLNVLAYYTRADYNDPLTNFWHNVDTKVLPKRNGGQSFQDWISTLSTGSMQDTFNVWGADHYNNKNPASGKTTSTTPQSQLDVIATDAGQAQTYSQSATQANTAQITQDINTSQSEDKVVQTVVQKASESIAGMVKNQNPT